jgi:hypothetical protein
MKKNKIKFAGPSKKMADALENEGLYVDWPKKIESESDLAIEGTFYTGCDWQKLVLIDLRDETDRDLSKKSEVDAAISSQLDEAYVAFNIDEEWKLNMEGTEEERAARGVPDAERLLEDMKEQEERLRRFSIVADAVYSGNPIPPEKATTEKMSLTAEEVLLIKAYRNNGIEGVKEWLSQ